MQGMVWTARRGLLIAAGFMSALQSCLGLGLWGFASDPKSTNLFVALFWLPALSALPLFMVVFFSPKWLRAVLRVLVFLNWCGQYALIQDAYQRGEGIFNHTPAAVRIPFMALFSFAGPEVIMAIAIASLTEYSYRQVVCRPDLKAND